MIRFSSSYKKNNEKITRNRSCNFPLNRHHEVTIFSCSKHTHTHTHTHPIPCLWLKDCKWKLSSDKNKYKTHKHQTVEFCNSHHLYKLLNLSDYKVMISQQQFISIYIQIHIQPTHMGPGHSSFFTNTRSPLSFCLPPYFFFSSLSLSLCPFVPLCSRLLLSFQFSSHTSPAHSATHYFSLLLFFPQSDCPKSPSISASFFSHLSFLSAPSLLPL